MKTEFINVNGLEFFVRTWGDENNPPLLLLHGFPEFGGAWEELATHLSDKYYCIAPDQRGFGQSAKPLAVENYRMSQLVGDVVGIINHYSPQAPIQLLGHDWGAAVAYVVAANVPQLVSKLIILNGVHPIPFQNELNKKGAQNEASQYINWLRLDGSGEKLAKNQFEKLIGLLSQDMDTEWFDEEKQQQYRQEWAREDCVETMLNWYKASPIKVPNLGKKIDKAMQVEINPDQMRIKMPHLVVWGKNDVALTIECRNGIYDFADDVKIVELDNLDHWLHHQNPKKIAKVIDDFL